MREAAVTLLKRVGGMSLLLFFFFFFFSCVEMDMFLHHHSRKVFGKGSFEKFGDLDGGWCAKELGVVLE